MTAIPMTVNFHSPLTAARTKRPAMSTAASDKIVMPGREALMSVKEAPENFSLLARSMLYRRSQRKPATTSAASAPSTPKWTRTREVRTTFEPSEEIPP